MEIVKKNSIEDSDSSFNVFSLTEKGTEIYELNVLQFQIIFVLFNLTNIHLHLVICFVSGI